MQENLSGTGLGRVAPDLSWDRSGQVRQPDVNPQVTSLSPVLGQVGTGDRGPCPPMSKDVVRTGGTAGQDSTNHPTSNHAKGTTTMNASTTFQAISTGLVCEVVELMDDEKTVSVGYLPVVGWYVTPTEEGPEVEAAVYWEADVWAVSLLVRPLSWPNLLAAAVTSESGEDSERPATADELRQYAARIESINARRAA